MWNFKDADTILEDARRLHPNEPDRAFAWAFGALQMHYEMALAEIERLKAAPCRHDLERAEVDEREGVERWQTFAPE